MKKLLHFIILLFSLVAFAQVPQGISYQAIALNGSGNAVANANVGISLSILDNSATGTLLYSETQVKTTNGQGLFHLVIGQGTAVSGTFASINWKTNSKFLKVEMDANGGSNYILTGTTQLLSVPYALAAKSLVLSAGEGITLTSPNGTPYQVSVNDAGQLSLPTSNNSSNSPSELFMYGSFNNFNPVTAFRMSMENEGGYTSYRGYKYLTAGTQIKFSAGNTAGSTVYGINGSLEVVQNGNAYTIPSTGFYFIEVQWSLFSATANVTFNSAAPMISFPGAGVFFPTYNVASNTFSFTFSDNLTGGVFYFMFANATQYGDALYDGTIDANGPGISLEPIVFGSPKNYRVDLVLNFNGSGTYTLTRL